MKKKMKFTCRKPSGKSLNISLPTQIIKRNKDIEKFLFHIFLHENHNQSSREVVSFLRD